MTSKSFGLTLAVAFACAFLPFAGVAQTFRGHVRGEITDPSMAVLSGATVTLLNVATGIKTAKTTDSSGLYVFDLVDAGTYSLTVEAPGFQKFVQQNVIVQSGGDVTVNASLSPGTLQQSVTVEADSARRGIQFHKPGTHHRHKDGERYAAARSESVQADAAGAGRHQYARRDCCRINPGRQTASIWATRT